MKAAAITQIVIQIQLCALTHSAILPIPPNLPSTPNGLSNQPKASSSPNGTLSILLLPSNNTQLNVAMYAPSFLLETIAINGPQPRPPTQ